MEVALEELVSVDHVKLSSSARSYVDVRLVLSDLVAPAPFIKIRRRPAQKTPGENPRRCCKLAGLTCSY